MRKSLLLRLRLRHLTDVLGQILDALQGHLLAPPRGIVHLLDGVLLKKRLDASKNLSKTTENRPFRASKAMKNGRKRTESRPPRRELLCLLPPYEAPHERQAGVDLLGHRARCAEEGAVAQRSTQIVPLEPRGNEETYNIAILYIYAISRL